MEEAVVALESSMLLLVRGLLEGSEVEEDNEIAEHIFDGVGGTNLLCNTVNYWNVSTYSTAYLKSFNG